jgi:peptidoglycan hydrolase CwlO-like protein
MAKKYGWYALSLLLVVHGSSLSMSRKIIQRTSRSKSSKRTCPTQQSLQNIENKLEAQNKLLQNLQQELVAKQTVHTKSYAFEIAKVEAKCKVYAANLREWRHTWALAEVEKMRE